jgi:myo-inositol catabolism protein IolS
MEYRTLGSTGLEVSVVGVGTWQFGGEWGRAYAQPEVDAVFDAARDCGINILDTAECYGDHASERFCGAAIERDRDRWVVCTKFGHRYHAPFERTEPRRPEDVAAQLEASLRALRTDRIDVYQFHSWGDDEFWDDGVLEVLHRAREQGKIRHVGNSVRVRDYARQVAASRERGIEVIQAVYNRLDRRAETDAFPVCREQNLGVLARVPLASGFLSGKYRPGHAFDKDEVRGRREQEQTDEALREVERIRREEVPPGVDMARWALAWCLKNPAVTCVIPGCKSPELVRGTAAAADLRL